MSARRAFSLPPTSSARIPKRKRSDSSPLSLPAGKILKSSATASPSSSHTSTDDDEHRAGTVHSTNDDLFLDSEAYDTDAFEAECTTTKSPPPPLHDPFLAEFNAWNKATTSFFNKSSPSFPTMASLPCLCDKCVRGEKLGICQHDVERVLSGGGTWKWKEMLKRERGMWTRYWFWARGLKWERWEVEAREMWGLISALVGEKK